MFNLSTVPQISVPDSEFNSASIKTNNFMIDLFVNDKIIDGINFITNNSLKQQYSAYDLSHGDVLINQLGIGYMTLWIASKENVSSVTVIEPNQDVIDLFLSNNKISNKIKIINNDLQNFKTQDHFNFAYLNHNAYDLNSQFIHKDYINSFIDSFNRNVPNCDNVWFYGIEQLHAQSVVPLTEHLEAAGSIFKRPHEGVPETECCCWDVTIAAHIGRYGIDFYESWNRFLKYNMPSLKVPTIDKDKFNEYIYTYYQKIGYGSLPWIRTKIA